MDGTTTSTSGGFWSTIGSGFSSLWNGVKGVGSAINTDFQDTVGAIPNTLKWLFWVGVVALIAVALWFFAPELLGMRKKS